MQLDIILTSLQDNSHVALLLGFTFSTGENLSLSDTQLAEVLMKTLLRNLGFHTVSCYLCSYCISSLLYGSYFICVILHHLISSIWSILYLCHTVSSHLFYMVHPLPV